MTPNHVLVQYIENEAFKGRAISDVLADVQAAGWRDDDILAAVDILNQEHDVLNQADLDPLNRKRKVHKHTYGLIAVVMFITIMVSLIVAGIVQYAQKPQLQNFTDSNYTMLLPEDWDVDGSYKGGIVRSIFHSPEFNRANEAGSAARMIVYADADEDALGTALREGGSGMRILNKQTEQHDAVTYIIIEFSGNDPVNGDQIHGVYAYINRGQIRMSATVTAPVEHWSKHADEAAKMVRSVHPSCSRASLSSQLSDNGTIMLCGQ